MPQLINIIVLIVQYEYTLNICSNLIVRPDACEEDARVDCDGEAHGAHLPGDGRDRLPGDSQRS